MRCRSPWTLPCRGGDAVHVVTLSGNGIRTGVYELCHNCYHYARNTPPTLLTVVDHPHWTEQAENEHPGILRIIARALGGGNQSQAHGSGPDDWTL
ncbi:MAG: hypothetical protein ACXWPI_19290 [Ktedonobacterales bacterium]